MDSEYHDIEAVCHVPTVAGKVWGVQRRSKSDCRTAANIQPEKANWQSLTLHTGYDYCFSISASFFTRGPGFFRMLNYAMN